MAKTTKQGVRDLGNSKPKHEHRFAPTTFTNRSGLQITLMRCYCGEDRKETPEEEHDRLLAEADVETRAYAEYG